MLRLVGLRGASESEGTHSEEELRLLLASSGQHGVLDPIEQELASRSLALGDLFVREVMVPRTAMAALPADTSLENARRLVIELARDRLPVYEDTRDNVVGYVKWVDLFAASDPGWATRLHPIVAVPESMSASVALARLRDANTELAVVLDEYGGTAGILTRRDILDEIAERQTTIVGTILPGTFPLHVLAAVDGIDVAGNADTTTLGGYVVERLGRVPKPGERVRAGKWDIVVERATDHAVASARLLPFDG